MHVYWKCSVRMGHHLQSAVRIGLKVRSAASSDGQCGARGSPGACCLSVDEWEDGLTFSPHATMRTGGKMQLAMTMSLRVCATWASRLACRGGGREV